MQTKTFSRFLSCVAILRHRQYIYELLSDSLTIIYKMFVKVKKHLILLNSNEVW